MADDIYGSSCSCGGVFNDLMVPVPDRGRHRVKIEGPSRIRQAVLEHAGRLSL